MPIYPAVTDRSVQDAMLYLLALFCSPLALLLTGRIFQAVFNLLIYVAAIVLSLTIVFWWPAGVIVWGVGVAHAVLVINNDRENRRNRALVEAQRRDV
jgi:hypothetical protein